MAAAKLQELWVDIVLAWRMALNDIKQRYRGSTLGPFWLVLSMLVTGGSVAIVYSVIFKVPYREYLAYLIVGMSAWIFISGLVVDASTCFIQTAGLIKNTQISLIVHVLRTTFRQVIILLHNILAILMILPFTIGIHPLGFLLGSLGCALVALVLLPYVAVVAFIGARFRDVAQIVVNVLQFGMLVTPVFWYANAVGPRGYVTMYNPLYHMVTVIRSPILGAPVSAANYLVLLAIGLFGFGAALASFRYQRRYVAFWV